MHTPFLQHSPSLHGGLHTSGVGRVGKSSTQDHRHHYVHLLIMIIIYIQQYIVMFILNCDIYNHCNIKIHILTALIPVYTATDVT